MNDNEWTHAHLSWSTFVNYLRSYEAVLDAASSDQLARWSPHDFAEAVAWGGLMEDVVETSDDGSAAFFDRAREHTTRLTWRHLSAGRHVLFSRVLNNPLADRPLLRTLLGDYFQLASADGDELQLAVGHLIADVQPIVRGSVVAQSLAAIYADLQRQLVDQAPFVVAASNEDDESSREAIFTTLATLPQRALARTLCRKKGIELAAYSAYLDEQPDFIVVLVLQVLCPHDAQRRRQLVAWLLDAAAERLWRLADLRLLAALCHYEPLLRGAYIDYLVPAAVGQHATLTRRQQLARIASLGSFSARLAAALQQALLSSQSKRQRSY